jgi:RNA-directed DNA polymerase
MESIVFRELAVTFDFLGYTFKPRLVKWSNGTYGVSFQPAASRVAMKSIRKSIRLWGLQPRSDKDLGDLARMFSPHIRGWINYYGHFYKSALYPSLKLIDEHLARWGQRKFKRLRRRKRRARAWLSDMVTRHPMLFPHWSAMSLLSLQIDTAKIVPLSACASRKVSGCAHSRPAMLP